MSDIAIPLVRQVDVALEKLAEELKGMTAGTIVLQIREDSVGRFGIRHLPRNCNGSLQGQEGLTKTHIYTLRKLALASLEHKNGWTHGEIAYDFVLKKNEIFLSVQFESNYNMANILFRYNLRRRHRRGASSE